VLSSLSPSNNSLEWGKKKTERRREVLLFTSMKSPGFKLEANSTVYVQLSEKEVTTAYWSRIPTSLEER